jgi:hypothetical protein
MAGSGCQKSLINVPTFISGTISDSATGFNINGAWGDIFDTLSIHEANPDSIGTYATQTFRKGFIEIYYGKEGYILRGTFTASDRARVF